ncbi:MAG: hypothetical protein RBR86_06490 [Pseudobdellovibrionaceae bacterium]|jgi:hypothetical protein|nr:hypothetical protein [Pseudobdellovibrionaceae bacterium]
MRRFLALLAVMAFTTPAWADNDFSAGQMQSDAYAAFDDPVNEFDPNAIEPAAGNEDAAIINDVESVEEEEESDATQTSLPEDHIQE